MRSIHQGLASAAVAAAFLLAAPSGVAEVSGGTPDDDCHYVLVLGLTEDPDPIGTMIQWEAVQPAADEVLNEDGAVRNDGRPDVAYLPGSGYPIVVWAQNAGHDYDVALSQWLGDRWSSFEYLGQSAADELDPRLHVDAQGRVRVAWWRDQGTGVVEMSTRNTVAGLWSLPRTVTTDGRRPSVLAQGDKVLVAFERDVAGGKRIVLAELRSDGSVTFEPVVDVDSNEPLDVVIHVYEGRVWLDWKAAPDTFAYSERTQSGWTAPVAVPWSDGSWLDEEMVRREVRSRVLFP